MAYIIRPNGKRYRLILTGVTRNKIDIYRAVDVETQRNMVFCVRYKNANVYGPICTTRDAAVRRAFIVAIAHHCGVKQR